ncbi:MAG: hypothetical protein IKP05_00560 [Alphaproteobacteria bacterium]|nr:hypothetical protein [Alphaproteobacteria bacterium]
MPAAKSQYFTKADFLTGPQYAKKHEEERELVEKAMKKAYLRRATVKVSNRLYEIITSDHGRLHLRPEEPAQQKFIEILNEIKGKNK